MKRYIDPFKSKVVAMIVEGRTISQVHRDLRLNRGTIRKWLADKGWDQETLQEARPGGRQ